MFAQLGADEIPVEQNVQFGPVAPVTLPAASEIPMWWYALAAAVVGYGIYTYYYGE